MKADGAIRPDSGQHPRRKTRSSSGVRILRRWHRQAGGTFREQKHTRNSRGQQRLCIKTVVVPEVCVRSSTMASYFTIGLAVLVWCAGTVVSWCFRVIHEYVFSAVCVCVVHVCKVFSTLRRSHPTSQVFFIKGSYFCHPHLERFRGLRCLVKIKSSTVSKACYTKKKTTACNYCDLMTRSQNFGLVFFSFPFPLYQNNTGVSRLIATQTQRTWQDGKIKSPQTCNNTKQMTAS